MVATIVVYVGSGHSNTDFSVQSIKDFRQHDPVDTVLLRSRNNGRDSLPSQL